MKKFIATYKKTNNILLLRALFVFLILILLKANILANEDIKYLSIKQQQIPLVSELDKSLPIIQLDLVFKNAGSIKNKIPSMSRFVSLILSEGTKDKPFSMFFEELDQRAINFSVHDGTETMVFSISCLKEEFSFGVSYLEELLKHPNLTKQAFNKVHLKIKSSILEQEENFDAQASNQLRKIIFKNSPLQFPKNGTLESIDKVTLSSLKDFIKYNITLSNAIVVLGGDFNDKDVKNITKAISHLQTSKEEEVIKYEITNNPTKKTKYKETKQAYIYFASPFNININSKDMYKAKVAFFILGSSGFGSRLMEEIRVKRGLAYSIYASLDVSKSSSSMQGYMQTKIENKDKSISLIKEQIKNFTQNGVTEKELDSAKKFILGSEPLRNETLSQRLGSKFNQYYKKLGKNSQKKFLDDVDNLSLKELNNFIKSHSEINDISLSIITSKGK